MDKEGREASEKGKSAEAPPPGESIITTPIPRHIALSMKRHEGALYELFEPPLGIEPEECFQPGFMKRLRARGPDGLFMSFIYTIERYVRDFSGVEQELLNTTARMAQLGIRVLDCTIVDREYDRAMLILQLVAEEHVHRDEKDEELKRARELTARMKMYEVSALIDQSKYMQLREGMVVYRGDTVFEVVHYGDGLTKYNEARVVEVLRAALRVRFNDDGHIARLAFRKLVMNVEDWEKNNPKEAQKVREQREKVVTLREEQAPEAPIRTRVIEMPSQKPRAKRSQPPPSSSDSCPLLTETKSALAPLPPQYPKQEIRVTAKEDEFEAWLSMGQEFIATIDRELEDATRKLRETSNLLENIDKQHHEEIEDLERELREAKERHNQARATLAARTEHLQRKVTALKQRKARIQPLLSEE